jgi:flavin-dependent dehydrogenase
MNSSTSDVAVVGGGPAGATAAAALARAGVGTLLLDQSSGDSFKVGEGLPPAAKPLLVELGVWDRLAADGHVKSHGNASAWGGPSLTFTHFLSDPHGHGWHLDRARFDASLRDLAREAGARIQLATAAQRLARTADGWQMTIDNGGHLSSIACRWVVDCSGRRAWVARLEGATRVAHDHLVAFVSLFNAADNVDDVDSLTLVESAPDGWWYTSRLPSGRVVVYFTDARDESARQARDAAGFTSLVDETVHVRARLAAHGYAASGPPQIVAADASRLDRVAGGRWIAAGDAALSFDPLSSQGILTGIYSGTRAARALLASLGGDETAIAEYNVRLDSIYSAHLDHQREYYRMEQRWPHRPFWKTRADRASRPHLAGS